MLDHYRGHESKPTAAYLRELELRTGGAPASDADDPFVKIDALIATGDALAKAAVAKVASLAADMAEIERRISVLLKASAPLCDQRGRPEHMSPVKWLERKTT